MLVTHLKKELRQSAPTLAALLVLVLVAAPGFTAVYFLLLHPDWSFDAGDFGWRIAAVAAAAALVALGDAAVPETREGNASLLARLPGALGPSYLARTVVLVAGTVLTTALAYGVTVGACAAIGDRLWFRTTTSGLVAYGGCVVGAAALGALWTLALVSGVRRGGLAFPAAALVAGVAVVPTAWALEAAGVWKRSGDVPFALAVLAVAAAVAGWLAFRGTFRWSRGPTAGAWRGVATLLLLTTPIPALGALRHHQWTTVDVDDDLRLFGALASTDGRRLFLAASRPWSGRREQALSLVFDVELGHLERADASILPAGYPLSVRGFERRPQPIVLVRRSTDDWRFVDSVTRETLHRAPGELVWSGLPSPFRRRLADAVRRTAPISLADGRPAWVADDETLQALEPDDSLSTVRLPNGFVPRWGEGHFLRSQAGTILDLRSMTLVENVPVRKRTHRVVAATDAGLLRWSPRGDRGVHDWVDHESGEVRTLADLGADATLPGWPGGIFDTSLRTRDGGVVLSASWGGERQPLVLDPTDATVRKVGPRSAYPVAVERDGSLLAVTHADPLVLRIDPDSGDVDVLFPPRRP